MRHEVKGHCRIFGEQVEARVQAEQIEVCGTPAAVRAVSQAALWAQTSAGASFTPKGPPVPAEDLQSLDHDA